MVPPAFAAHTGRPRNAVTGDPGLPYGDLSTLLKVQYPPKVVLVDGTGTIQEIWNGYVDEGSLNQSLVNLGQV